MDIVDVIFDLPGQLKSLMGTLKEFLFSSVNIGGEDISVWGLLAGVGIISLIIISIING